MLESKAPTTVSWVKSTRCETGACVEAALIDDKIAVRNSTYPNGPVTLFTRPEWDAFIGGVKEGEFDFRSA